MSDIDPDRPEQHTMGLVVPFTACQSHGGSFDDESFVHGFDVGALHAEMQILAAAGATPRPRWLKPAILDQADLFAMHHGYVMKRGETEPAAGWVHVEFVRPDPHGVIADE